MLINDDCLNAVKKIDSCSIDLIYLDPPFFTQKSHVLTDKTGKKYIFEDIWDSLEDYIIYLKYRLIEFKRILKDTGNIFLHCDTSASHYIRILLDEIFGMNNFRNEIIWCYKKWSNSKKGLLDAHQTILFYSKTNNYKFNTVYTNYSLTTNIDQILQERTRNNINKSIYKVNKNGNIVLSKEKRGVPLSDIWEIPFLNPKAKERVGYPTQKPILLLERIIEISSDRGDLILDPFCGSGTTLVAANLMDRRFIGIDKNIEAITLAKDRLRNPVISQSQLLNRGIDVYDTKTEFEKSILRFLDCDVVQRNKGIDAILRKYYNNSPVAVRIQKKGESLSEAISLLVNAGEKKRCSLCILIKIDNISELINFVIPENVLVIESYSLVINNYLDKIYSKDIKLTKKIFSLS